MKTVLKNLFLLIFTLLFLIQPVKLPVDAAVTCPKNLTDMQCYNYLNKKLDELQKNQGSLRNKLKNEEYQQLTLKEKIEYIDEQMLETEKVIDTLETEIAAQDIDIKLLTVEIQIQEDNIDVLKQEIVQLENTVTQRVTESYKYSFVSPFELLFDEHSLDSILRKTKYILETRQRDKSSLEDLNKKSQSLKEQETLLTTQRADLQSKRNEVEEEKSKLVEERSNLDSQREEKDKLLAESLRRESEYRADLASASAAISETDELISDLVIKLFNQGKLGNGSPIVAGQIIGYQGHTGCSFGSHLHFEIRNRYDTRLNPNRYLNGGTTWGSITSKIYMSPLDGAVLTQTFKEPPYYSKYHRAWDMYSSTRGDHSGATYKVPTGICAVVDGYIRSSGRDYAYLTGEGAPVKAVAKGKVYYGTSVPSGPNGKKYPAKYALVVHSDGNKSFYLHLK